MWTIWTASQPLAAGVDKSLSQRIWRTRQIGILFAKVNDSWVFLVLIAPLSLADDYEVSSEDEFNFCYRDPKQLKQAPYAWHASDAPVRDIIDYLARGLQEKGQQWVAHILIDIYWGWERYLAQVKNDIRGV